MDFPPEQFEAVFICLLLLQFSSTVVKRGTLNTVKLQTEACLGQQHVSYGNILLLVTRYSKRRMKSIYCPPEQFEAVVICLLLLQYSSTVVQRGKLNTVKLQTVTNLVQKHSRVEICFLSNQVEETQNLFDGCSQCIFHQNSLRPSSFVSHYSTLVLQYSGGERHTKYCKVGNSSTSQLQECFFY